MLFKSCMLAFFINICFDFKRVFFIFSNRNTNGGGGVSVTQSSGSPYLHGRPRFPVQQPQQLQQQQQQQPSSGMQLQYPQYTFSTGGMATGATHQQQLELQQLQIQQQQQMLNGQGGYLQQGMSTNGFMPASLSVPSGGMSMQQQLQHQSLPVQAIRPIQPVQVR